MSENIWFTFSAILNLCLVLMMLAYRALWRECGRRWKRDKERLNWLDLHTAFVADEEYVIGPYKRGELHKMADDGIAKDMPIIKEL